MTSKLKKKKKNKFLSKIKYKNCYKGITVLAKMFLDLFKEFTIKKNFKKRWWLILVSSCFRLFILTSILFFDEPKFLGKEYCNFQEISWAFTECIREIVVFSWSRFLIYILNLIVLSILFSLRKKQFFVGIFETWQTKKSPKRSNSRFPKN